MLADQLLYRTVFEGRGKKGMAEVLLSNQWPQALAVASCVALGRVGMDLVMGGDPLNSGLLR